MSAAKLAELCSANPVCKGFTSSGWLKNRVKLPALWADWGGPAAVSPCDGMFVKNGSEYEGKKVHRLE